MERAIVINNARIITMDGETIERGDVLIKGARIQAVGADVDVPFADRLTAKKIDAAGKTITPGFIDVWSGLGRAGGAINPDATASAWDAFNGFANGDIAEALRNGVTSIYLAPGGKAGIKGLAVVVQLARAATGGFGKRLANEAALCIDLGSEESSIARAKTYQDVRKKFRAAVEYRKALEDYEEELKEYVKKLEERKKAAEKSQDKKKNAEGDKSEPAPDSSKEKPGKEKPAEEPKPESGGPAATSIAVMLGITESNADLARGKPPEGPRSGDGQAKAGEGKPGAKAKDDEIKKPVKPKHDPTSEVLLRAIDHQLVVRIEAHRSADILNALALADEYNLDIVLEGATDAHLLANRIAETNVSVVLGQTVRTGLHEANEFRRHAAENYARLRQAGVSVSIGSGGDPAGTRFVALNAQAALALDLNGSRSELSWIRAVTSAAAESLGLSTRVGRIAPGLQADLVLWSEHPESPSARVEQVFVAGEPVYPLPQQ